nr:MAG TPA: hypothetical protein [Caudoviricetes sp.]
MFHSLYLNCFYNHFLNSKSLLNQSLYPEAV